MRILMVSEFYLPHVGGAENHIHTLCTELIAYGHDVAVVTLWREGLPTFEYYQGVRVYRIRASVTRIKALFTNHNYWCAPPFTDPEMLLALRRIIIDEGPDIVHAHSWMVHSFTPLKAWSKAKLVVTLHDCNLTCATNQFLHHGTLCSGPGVTKCLKCAASHYGIAKGIPIALALQCWQKIEHQTVDMFLAVSQAVADVNQLAKYDLPYRVIPNFIPNDLDMLLPDNNDSYIAQLPKDNYLLYVGRIEQLKGVEVLLQAYSDMETDIPLVLIGRIAADFSTPIPPNVYVLNSWPHASVMGAWSRCSIAFVPSICPEACPTVAMEAMLKERPVIASRIGGLPEVVIDGETGVLVPPGNIRALREAIQCLLADPLLRTRMGVKGKQQANEFLAHRVVHRIERVYEEVLCL